MPGHDVRSPREIAAALDELWSPRVIAEVDENYVKVAKVHGTFGWHAQAAVEHDEQFVLVGVRMPAEGAVDLRDLDVVFVDLGDHARRPQFVERGGDVAGRADGIHRVTGAAEGCRQDTWAAYRGRIPARRTARCAVP